MADVMSPQLKAAWDRWSACREQARAHLFSSEPAQRTQIHGAAFALLLQNESAIYQQVFGVHTDYPRFYVAWEPLLYDGWKPCPDFKYRHCWVDGTRTYRVWGRRGDTLFCDVQHRAGPAFGEGAPTNYNFNDWCDADGNFEVILSAERQSGHWLKLDPNSRSNHLMVREAFVDWEREDGTEMHIEPIDNKPARPLMDDETSVIARVDHAIQQLTYVSEQYNEKIFLKTLGSCGNVPNTFAPLIHAADSGAHMGAHYVAGVFDLQPDEALVFEFQIPRCAYWGVHLANSVNRTIDYVYHQSSLNNAQATVDADGYFRAVVSDQDPGVPNWLDQVGAQRGVIQLRFYLSDAGPVPKIVKVPVSDIRNVLPADTPVVTPEQRARQLSQRSRAALKRYGF